MLKVDAGMAILLPKTIMIIKVSKVESELRKAEAKAIIKEAIREWLDEQFAIFGKCGV